jgi:hypothetical protein
MWVSSVAQIGEPVGAGGGLALLLAIPADDAIFFDTVVAPSLWPGLRPDVIGFTREGVTAAFLFPHPFELPRPAPSQ